MLRIVLLSLLLAGLPRLAGALTYEHSPEPFNWIDPATHTDVVWTAAPGGPVNECQGPSAPVDDDISQEIPLGFRFQYGTGIYTSVRIMSNGRLQFNNRYCGYGTQTVGPPRTYPYDYPNNSLQNTLRVYGADLNPAEGGTVRYASLGTAPNRMFVVTWSNVPEWNAGGSSFNLQVILRENGDFIYQFGPSNNPTLGHAQIGWELTTSDYDLISFADIGSLANTAIRFHLPEPVAEYRFDETAWNGTPGEVTDSSGNGLDGDALNGARPAPAKVCNGATLDGTSQYLNIPDQPLLNITDELTVTAWIRPYAIPSGGLKTIVSKDWNYEFHVNSAGQIYWWWNDSTGGVHTLTTTGTALVAGLWYHIAIVYSRNGGYQRIYINGTERAASARSEALRTTTDPLQIGADQGFTGREFDGQIDEVRIYHSALNAEQINTVMRIDRPCPTTPTNHLLLSTTNNETLGGLTFTPDDLVDYDPVADTATLYFDGTHFSNNENIDAVDVLSNGLIVLSTTGSARLGGLNFRDGDLVAYDPSTDTATLFFSEDRFSANEDVDAVHVLPNGHILLSTTGSAQLGGLNFRDGDIVEYDPASDTASLFFSEDNFSANEDIDGFHLLDNGNLLISTTSTATLGSLTFTDGSIAEYDPVTGIATLYFDESRFSNGADINAVDLLPPVIPLDHLRIEHDGTALTCQPETVTLRACANADCSTTYAGNVTVTLTPSGWVGGDTVSFSGGSTTVSLRHVTPGTVTLGTGNTAPVPASPATCLDTATNAASCDLTFYDSGFVYSIPTQTACAVSTPITIAAVRKDVTTQRCVPAFANRTADVNFWTTYVDPATGTRQLTLNNGTTDTLLPTASPGAAVPLAFDANGEATVTVQYPDAGRLSLNSRFTGSGAESGLVMTGSADFVTKPARFVVQSPDLNADCPSGDATCSVFRAAGDAFNLTVRAACADGTVTPNFAHDNIAIQHNLVAPAAGSPGSIAVTSTAITAADNGQTTITNQSVSEVGVFSFTVQLGTPWLGETAIGDAASNTSPNIGRFTPAWFDVTRVNGCDAGNFTYSGQPFVVTATAYNSAGNITGNYAGALGFAFDTTVSDAGDTTYFTNNVIPAASFGTGIGTRSDVTYTFPSPLTAPASLTLRATDGDGISSLGHQEPATDIHSGRVRMANAFGSELLDLAVPMRVEHYDGSAFVDFPSDTCSLATLTLNKVDGTLGVGTGANAGETCIRDDDGESGTNNCSDASQIPGPVTEQFTEPPANASFNLWLKAPGQNFTGSVDVNATVDSWLRFDWNGDGTPDDPTARATFGIYRGDDRIIYWRERFD